MPRTTPATERSVCSRPKAQTTRGLAWTKASCHYQLFVFENYYAILQPPAISHSAESARPNSWSSESGSRWNFFLTWRYLDAMSRELRREEKKRKRTEQNRTE